MATQRTQKNLTVMFTDISGFTKHTETISREALMSRLDTHNELLMPVIAHFEGKIVKTIGDAFLITFESPTNAVQCGLFMQHTLRKYNVNKAEGEQIHIKVSINSGEVTVTESDVFGDPVNVAAKIEKATNPDEIYFTEAVFLAMNKSEVPTSFVKAFRPKGADSSEIKLYKVAMDEADERYKRIISGTTIDKDKMKTRVLELSNLAEKEFTRYQDTLDALVESQGKSSRGMVIAVIAAAVILGVAVLVGLWAFGGQGESEEQKTIATARLFLNSDKPEDARELLLKYAQTHGTSDAISGALGEVDAYQLNEATRQADKLLEAGDPVRALAFLNDAMGKREAGPDQKALIARAEAFIAARVALSAGNTALVREKANAAAGSKGLSSELKNLVALADAIDTATAIIDGKDSRGEPRIRRESNAAIEALAAAWGNDFKEPVVQALLIKAMKARLYWEARDKSLEDGQKLLENYKQRFVAISDWLALDWEVDLGGFWNYSTDPAKRRNWQQWHSADWTNHRDRLYTASSLDPEVALRVAETYIGINRHHVTAAGQNELELGITARPEMLDTHRDRILALVKEFLQRQLWDDAYARNLVRQHFYDELKPFLVAGLWANYDHREASPNMLLRANSFALLADRGELEAIEDPFAYFRDHFEMFMDSNWTREDDSPNVTREQTRRLFALEMSADSYREFIRLLNATSEDIANKRGRWGMTNYGAEQISMIRQDLKEAQPQHAHIVD